jgi:hypothetical protein
MAVCLNPTEILDHNSARIPELSPFRIVVGAMVLKPTFALSKAVRSVFEKVRGEWVEALVSVIEASEESQEPILARISMQKQECTTAGTGFEYECGLLIPFDRMAFLGGFFQRVNVQMSFEDCYEGNFSLQFVEVHLIDSVFRGIRVRPLPRRNDAIYLPFRAGFLFRILF